MTYYIKPISRTSKTDGGLECLRLKLQNGYKLELKKADTGDVQLEIFNENGELIQECTVFNAAL